MTQRFGSRRFSHFARLLLGTILLLVGVPRTVDAKISPPFMAGSFEPQPEIPFLPTDRAALPLGERFVLQIEERLWLTDGTEEGTFSLCEPVVDSPCPEVSRLLAGGARVFFLGVDRRLWVTDGTLDGTIALTDPPVVLEVEFISQNAADSPERGLLFFAAHHPLRGFEPWVTDGTREGTFELADLAPGGRSSGPEFWALVGERIVFTAEDLDHGLELWVSDGTPEGTRFLRDIRPGPQSSLPQDFRSLGDRVVFTAGDAPNSRALWVTDGTEPGTRLLLDVESGGGEPRWVVAAETAEVGLFFHVRSLAGEAFWITDGTLEGTRELHRFETPAADRFPPEVAGNHAFFRNEDETWGVEPWVSDGTPEGTHVLDLCPGPCSSVPFFFEPFGGQMYFSASVGEPFERDIHVSDGTLEGTRSLGLDLEPTSLPTFLAGNDQRLYFHATTVQEGPGLWVSEAPFVKATQVADFGSVNGPNLLLGDDWLGLSLDSEKSIALWRSDATAAGTKPLETLIEPRRQGPRPSHLTRLGDRIFFTTASNRSTGLPSALWSTRGTPPSTVKLVSGPIPVQGLLSPELQSLTPLGDRLLFLNRNPDGQLDLWALQADGETPVLLEPGITGFLPTGPLATTGDRAFLISSRDEKAGLWVTDGTVEGTRRVHEVLTSEAGSRTIFQGRLVFSGGLDGSGGDAEPWVSDGTADGTFVLADLNPDGPSHPRDFTPVADLLFFTVQGPEGRQLWRTDGTVPGTRRVDLPPEATLGADSLTRLGDRLLFISFVEVLEPEQDVRVALWSTDGTRDGTVLLANPVFTRFQDGLDRIVLGTEMFFLDAKKGPTQIWRTDGTPAGTFPSLLTPPGSEPTAIHGVDGQLMIEAQAPGGPELWWSEVNLFADEKVGDFGDVGEPTRLGQLVVFRGTRSDVGSELWAFETQDFGGTNQPPAKPPGLPRKPDRLEVFPIGTPGPLRLAWRDRSNNETSFVVQAKHPLQPEFATVAEVPAGTQLVDVVIFTNLPITFRVRAENGNGVSDWSEEASGRTRFDLFSCVPSDKRLCLLDGRFEVQVHWRDPFNGGDGIGHARPFDFSDDSGSFWFFDADNVELVVKVLDAQTVNGFYWTFYGALSNVEYWVTVTDVLEGTSRTYHNPPRNLCGLGDTQAFPRFEPAALLRGDLAEQIVRLDFPDAPVAASVGSAHRARAVDRVPAIAAGTAGTCAESATALCLTGKRFRVEVSWRDPRSGDTGVGFAIPGTDDSGFFWFFDPENVELVAKVLDARTVNGNVWFFYGALSDVEYTITVTDTVNDVARTYRNPPFEICGRADTAAF